MMVLVMLVMVSMMADDFVLHFVSLVEHFTAMLCVLLNHIVAGSQHLEECQKN